jgi:hypothetical protein
MSTNYHTAYPAAMDYKTSNLNVPPGELDAQITINVAAIALRLQASSFMCLDNEILCLNDEPLTMWV